MTNINDVGGNQIHEAWDGARECIEQTYARDTVKLVCSVCGRSLDTVSDWVMFECRTRRFACSVECRIRLASQ